jgi:hypothetical protein
MTTTIEPFTDKQIEQLRETTGPVLFTPHEVRAIVQRFDNLRAAVDNHELFDKLNQATFEGQQVRAMGMAEALTEIAADLLPMLVGWQETGKIIAVRNKALAALDGIPALPAKPEPLSPTVAINVLAKAVMALCRSNPGEAWQHMRQLGELGPQVPAGGEVR